MIELLRGDSRATGADSGQAGYNNTGKLALVQQVPSFIWPPFRIRFDRLLLAFNLSNFV